MQPAPQKLAILAGGGSLPRQVAEACQRDGIPFLAINLGGVAGEWIAEHDPLTVSLGQVGKLLDTMAAHGCDTVTMAGPIARPQLSRIRFDWQGAKVLPRVAKLFRQGDDALLSGIAEIFEEQGFRVIGPQAVLGDVVAHAGLMTIASPDEAAMQDIARARAILDALGSHDVGQGVVVANGVCLAVEAAEGTAMMLRRVAELRRDDERSGVLVKLPKRGQDRRIDLPAIGPDTVTAAALAHLSGIAVEADGGLVIDGRETIRRCDADGLFLIGLDGAAV